MIPSYAEMRQRYRELGLVDITPERTQYPDTLHFMDTRVSDDNYVAYYVFIPHTGMFRRRYRFSGVNTWGEKYVTDRGYAINRRKTMMYPDGNKYRVHIPVHDIAEQMYLALSTIEAYRRARKLN
jgi:hypothetical protein